MSKTKLPALAAVSTGNPALDQLLRNIIEVIQVREGSRGDKLEQVLTKRDLKDLGLDTTQWTKQTSGDNARGILVQQGDGGYALVSTDAFSDALRKTRLYRDLSLRIDDASRFDGMPDKVKALLLKSIADEAAQRGADVQRLEYKVQSDIESLAYTVQEVTASVTGSVAGVRETAYAAATANEATAGKVTQIEARLDDVGGVTIETAMTATASRVSGLAGEYMVKIGAGGAVAGFGLAASEDLTGATESTFIVEANQFSLVAPINFSQETTPSATVIGQVWYTPSTKVYKRASATGTASWATFTPTSPFGVDTKTGQTFINGSLTVNSGGTALQDTPPGTRGTIITKVSTGWESDAVGYNAVFAVANAAGAYPLNPIKGDIVSYNGGAKECTVAGNPGTWAAVAAYIDGSLIVNGTMSADKISAGTISSSQIDTDKSIRVSGASWVSGAIAAGTFNTSNASSFGVIATSNLANAIQGSYSGSTAGRCGVAGVSSFTGYYGVIAQNQSTNGKALSVGGVMDVTNVTTGTSPINLPASSSVCTNLNANYLQGKLASAFYLATNPSGFITSAGSITGTANNALALNGIAASVYLRNGGAASGNPGTSFTHTLFITANGITVRVPCFYP